MFRNAKVGDRVWDFLKGWGTVIDTSWDEDYPIFVKFDYEEFKTCFTYKGFADADDKNPTLFWDEIKFEIPEKSFDLKEFLKENLEPKEFCFDENNYFLYFNFKEEIDYSFTELTKSVADQYFTRKNIQKVVNILNKNEVTFEQLKQAFRELEWI